jgi:hypothetical protein
MNRACRRVVAAGLRCNARDDATQAIVPVAVQNQTCHCALLAVWRSFVYGRLGGCFGVD